MADEGLIDSSPGRAFHKSGGIPKVTVLRVTQVDDGGAAWAVPEQWHAETDAPKLRLIERGRKGALGIGDRVLARTEERGDEVEDLLPRRQTGGALAGHVEALNAPSAAGYPCCPAD
jgi:ribonuclease R